MAFRDESEALRARVEVLERDLGDAQREAERAEELERELAAAKAELERLEKDEVDGEEALRAELARTRKKLEEAEARARARPASALEREAEEATRELDRLRTQEKRRRDSKAWGLLITIAFGAVALIVAALLDSAGDDRARPTDYGTRFDDELPGEGRIDLDSARSARPPGPRTDRDPVEEPLADPPSGEAPPVEPPRERTPREPDVLVRRWGTSTTQGWRHANGRCEIVVRLDETLSVTCRGEELYRGFVPCAPDRTSCRTPDGDAVRVDFAGGRALVRTDEGPIEIALDPGP